MTRWIILIFLASNLVRPVLGEENVFRLGVIGLDTSHVPAFVSEFNHDPPKPELHNCRVVAAYPHGSRDIESSLSRIPQYTEAVRKQGVEIVGSIDELLSKVDGVLLETNDGKPHLAQALKVFAAGKPVFIDKPVGSNLAEVVAIYRAAKDANVPMFSTSSLRYISGLRDIAPSEIGQAMGCQTHSPCSMEPSHTDLFWYGIHGVEPLFVCMGADCIDVRHQSTPTTELAVGRWQGDRLGTYRGIKKGRKEYGGMVFGTTKNHSLGKYDGYRPLVLAVADFFRSGEAPVSSTETLAIYAFMQAAQESKNRNGDAVTLAEVMAAAELEATALLTKQRINE